MNAAYVHIALNHIPVIGTFFGLLVLVIAALRASEEMKRLGLLIFVLVGVVTVPAYLSGKAAEEVVEGLPGVEEERIETHEDAGLPAAIAAWVLGALALVGLWAFRPPSALPAWLVAGALLLSLAVGGLMARAADLGGEIRHQEIRKGSQAPRS